MNKLVSLPFIETLDKNLSSNSGLIQVILGPRQVGKTTSVLDFLQSKYSGTHLFFSAEKYSHNSIWLREVWTQATKEKKLLVIDEIQKIENWSETIKSLWDENKKLKSKTVCVLLGSSSLELHQGLTESLTGRFQLIQAYHWNFHESALGYGLTFEDYLKFGGYPGSYEFRKSLIDWRNYIQKSIIETVVEKDILAEQKVKSPSLFRQSFDLLIGYPAQEISFTKLLGQLQDKGNTDLIKHYIKLFEGAFLIKTLEKFSTNKLKKKTSSPKIIPLCPAFSFIDYLDEYDSERRGHIFEAMVGAALLRTDFELYYWREKSHEVDYILKFGKKIWAIEVKSGRKKKLQGLSQFLKNFPQATPLVITPENYLDLEREPLKLLGIDHHRV